MYETQKQVYCEKKTGLWRLVRYILHTDKTNAEMIIEIQKVAIDSQKVAIDPENPAIDPENPAIWYESEKGNTLMYPEKQKVTLLGMWNHYG